MLKTKNINEVIRLDFNLRSSLLLDGSESSKWSE